MSLKNIFTNHAQELENDINKYLEVVSNSNMVFHRDSLNFIKGNIEVFENSLDEISTLENSADDYQKEIIEDAIQKTCGIYVSATASGKSNIIAYIIKILYENKLTNKHIIIVPPTSLIKQFYVD